MTPLMTPFMAPLMTPFMVPLMTPSPSLSLSQSQSRDKSRNPEINLEFSDKSRNPEINLEFSEISWFSRNSMIFRELSVFPSFPCFSQFRVIGPCRWWPGPVPRVGTRVRTMVGTTPYPGYHHRAPPPAAAPLAHQQGVSRARTRLPGFFRVQYGSQQCHTRG